MGQPSRCGRLVGICLLCAAAVSLPGCFGPQLQPTPELAQPCLEVPKCARDHVYVFLLNGLDPFNCCHFQSLRGYVNNLGFKQTYSGEFYHAGTFAREICRLRKADPDARFAAIGFSFGANAARCLCEDLRKDGVTLDLLIYLGGDTLGPAAAPGDNAQRVLNVTAKGCLLLVGGLVWKGCDLPGADNSRLPDAHHEDIPTHTHTLEIVARELTLLAASIPVMIPARPPALEEGPMPQSIMPRTSAKPITGWDCLKPSPTIDLKK